MLWILRDVDIEVLEELWDVSSSKPKAKGDGDGERQRLPSILTVTSR